MATLGDLVVRLLNSVVELVVIFIFDVALRDPLTFLVWAVGAAITTVAVGFFGVLVAGAAVSALGDAI